MSERILKDYIVASSSDIILDLCNHGYELYGYPVIQGDFKTGYSFVQALVKYETEEEVSTPVDSVGLSKAAETMLESYRLRLLITEAFSKIVMRCGFPNECGVYIGKIAEAIGFPEESIVSLFTDGKKFTEDGYIYALDGGGKMIDRIRIK